MKISIVGASSITAQHLIRNLASLNIEINQLIGSSNSASKLFREVVESELGVSPQVLNMRIQTLEQLEPCDIVVSCIQTDNGLEIEKELIKKAKFMITNTKYHRDQENAALLSPGVNDHLISSKQRIYCVPNCVVAGAVPVLHALASFSPISLLLTSLQSISGAGLHGISSLAIHDNILPHIESEEEKIKQELHVLHPKLKVNARCYRVPIARGHVLDMSISLGKISSPQAIRNALIKEDAIIEYCNASHFPQPKLHISKRVSMPVSVGNVNVQEDMVRCTALVDNLDRGAAGSVVYIVQQLITRRLV